MRVCCTVLLIFSVLLFHYYTPVTCQRSSGPQQFFNSFPNHGPNHPPPRDNFFRGPNGRPTQLRNFQPSPQRPFFPGPFATSTESGFDDFGPSNSSRPLLRSNQSPVPFFSPPRGPFFQNQPQDNRNQFGGFAESTERLPPTRGPFQGFQQGFSSETPSSSEFGSFDSQGRFHHPPPLRPPPPQRFHHTPGSSNGRPNFQPSSFEEDRRPSNQFVPFRPSSPVTFSPQDQSPEFFEQVPDVPQDPRFQSDPGDSFQPSPAPAHHDTQAPQDIGVSVMTPGMSGLTDPRLRPQLPPPPPPPTTTTTHIPPPQRTTTVVTTRRPVTTLPTHSQSEQVIFSQSQPTHRPIFEDIQQSLSASGVAPLVGSPATVCNFRDCQLPNCFCGGNKMIPGNLKASDIPQMVLLTFDDSVNDINYQFYQSILGQSGRKNPNGCPISATFYVSHEWTDYGKIQTLYSQGNEIASHSITHSDGAPFNEQRWTNEIYGQKKILSAVAGVPIDKIKGMRAPFLQGGGNTQFSMLYNTNFTYDSSMPAHTSTPPIWPYTLDYHIPHDCAIPPCPRKSYPGVWEVPMCMWEDLKGGSCSMADACQNPSDARGVYDMMVKNFRRHYTTNRAPFPMFYHYAWFTTQHHKEAFLAFLDAILKLPDVYLVTNSQMIDWIRNPTPLSRINSFQPWSCGGLEGRSGTASQPCPKSHKCAYRFKGDERFFNTCQPCPEKYPWLDNHDTLRVTV